VGVASGEAQAFIEKPESECGFSPAYGDVKDAKFVLIQPWHEWFATFNLQLLSYFLYSSLKL
jgi:hypothetical protein